MGMTREQRIEAPALRSLVERQFAALFAWASRAEPSPGVAVHSELGPVVAALAAVRGRDACAVLGPAPVANGAPLDPRRAVVLFSGGKDSLAAALQLRNEGIAPVLLYVRKINGAAYGREEGQAAELAAFAGFPFRVVEAQLTGKSAHIENPTKNLYLAALGAAFAARHGAGVVALGCLAHDGENAKNFSCGLSDDPAFLELAGRALEAFVPGLQLRPALHESDADSFARVWHELPEALPRIGSCLTGPRAHGIARQANERKFKAALMPGRCGSCYKCAFELIACAALSRDPLSPELGVHCVEKLQAGLQTIRGAAVKPSPVDALDAFFTPAVPGLDPKAGLLRLPGG